MPAPISTVFASLTLAIALAALGAGGASACGLWFCEPALRGSDYPPAYVPTYDPRVGPRWTNNGWSYPSQPRDIGPAPDWSNPPRGYVREYDERIEPARPLSLK